MLTCLALAGGPSAQSAVADAFDPGLRWSHAADPDAPWIPRDVVLSPSGELVWAAPAIGTPGLVLLDASLLPGPASVTAPLQEASLPGALGGVSVAAGDAPDELFASWQVPAPTASSRRTLVSRLDAVAAAHGFAFAPVWTHDFGSLVNGPGLVACSRDGELLAAAIYDSAGLAIEVALLDPGSGVPRVERRLPATGLRALVVDPEGRRIAIAAGTTHYVLDEAGDTRLALSEPGASGAIALSSGGARFARGREGGAEVYVDQGSGYAFEVDRPAGAYELATSVALSADGGVWAISWWNASDGVSSRLEVLDRASGARTNHVTQLGAGVAGLQNLPVRIALTPDGSRAAWGLWGTGDKRPEVLVVESAGGAPVLEVDLPGSVEALAFSEDGTRVAVAAKDTHANRFSTTGRVLLFDTGERDLQRVGTARPGGTLELELSTPTPCTSVFAFGFERSVPLVTGFGDVWVDFDEPHFLRSAQTVGDRASLSVPISAASSVIGLPLLVQGLRLLSSGPELATHLVRLRVL